MIAIKFRNVSKSFKIYQNKSYSIKEIFINKLLRRNKLEVHKHPVLTNVSFDINEGETVGIIGQNEAIHVTLKLITKILYPDEGTRSVEGKFYCY